VAKVASSPSNSVPILYKLQCATSPTPRPLAVEGRDSHLIQRALIPKSLHPEQDFDPFSRFCTAQPGERQADTHRGSTVAVGQIECIRRWAPTQAQVRLH